MYFIESRGFSSVFSQFILIVCILMLIKMWSLNVARVSDDDLHKLPTIIMHIADDSNSQHSLKRVSSLHSIRHHSTKVTVTFL